VIVPNYQLLFALSGQQVILYCDMEQVLELHGEVILLQSGKRRSSRLVI
jgi:hypothetical protein